MVGVDLTDTRSRRRRHPGDRTLIYLDQSALSHPPPPAPFVANSHAPPANTPAPAAAAVTERESGSLGARGCAPMLTNVTEGLNPRRETYARCI